MSILFNAELEEQFLTEVASTKKSILILSAFLKSGNVEWLQGHITPDVDVTVVSRWRMNDLLCGASDLSAYEVVQERGWKFAINTNMHHKLYLFDNKSLIIGSANFTKKGFHLGINGNDESSVKITPSEVDLLKLNNYVEQCCFIDNHLYLDMQKTIAELQNQGSAVDDDISWPTSIINKVKPACKNLWVNDLLFNCPVTIQNVSGRSVDHDLFLLNIGAADSICDRKKILTNIRGATLWQWLVEALSESESEYVRFGEITAKLHNDLIDDPKPYRKDVKGFVSNIFKWVEYLQPPEIGIKKFNRTEALYLASKF